MSALRFAQRGLEDVRRQGTNKEAMKSALKAQTYETKNKTEGQAFWTKIVAAGATD